MIAELIAVGTELLLGNIAKCIGVLMGIALNL